MNIIFSDMAKGSIEKHSTLSSSGARVVSHDNPGIVVREFSSSEAKSRYFDRIREILKDTIARDMTLGLLQERYSIDTYIANIQGHAYDPIEDKDIESVVKQEDLFVASSKDGSHCLIKNVLARFDDSVIEFEDEFSYASVNEDARNKRSRLELESYAADLASELNVPSKDDLECNL